MQQQQFTLIFKIIVCAEQHVISSSLYIFCIYIYKMLRCNRFFYGVTDCHCIMLVHVQRAIFFFWWWNWHVHSYIAYEGISLSIYHTMVKCIRISNLKLCTSYTKYTTLRIIYLSHKYLQSFQSKNWKPFQFNFYFLSKNFSHDYIFSIVKKKNYFSFEWLLKSWSCSIVPLFFFVVRRNIKIWQMYP